VENCRASRVCGRAAAWDKPRSDQSATRRTKFGDDGNQIGAHSALAIPHLKWLFSCIHFGMDNCRNEFGFDARPHLFPLPQERTTRRMVSGWWKAVRQIQSREFSRSRRAILLLLGEKAGMREVVKPIADWSRGSPCEIWQRQWEALAQGTISQGSPCEIWQRQWEALAQALFHRARPVKYGGDNRKPRRRHYFTRRGARGAGDDGNLIAAHSEFRT
jgi:hypothetical protein